MFIPIRAAFIYAFVDPLLLSYPPLGSPIQQIMTFFVEGSIMKV
jgi:hypothetical protein